MTIDTKRDKDNMIQKNESSGFRKPCGKEKELIALYIWKTEIRNLHILMCIGLAFCSVVTAYVLINFWKNSGEYSVENKTTFVALLIAVIWCAVSMQKARHRKKELWRKIKQGEYEVIDCRSYCIEFPLFFFQRGVRMRRLNRSSLLLCCDDFYKVIPKKG